MTEGEAAKIVAVVLASWPERASWLGEKQVAPMIGTWAKALVDVPYDLADRALRRLQATSSKMPSPADVRAAADELVRGVARPPAEAWGDVLKRIGSKGRNRPPGDGWDFADPLTRRAVDALGWLELCNSENVVADRARFLQVYENLVDADRVEAVTVSLPGAAAPRRVGGATSIGELMSGIKGALPERTEGKKKR